MNPYTLCTDHYGLFADIWQDLFVGNLTARTRSALATQPETPVFSCISGILLCAFFALPRRKIPDNPESQNHELIEIPPKYSVSQVVGFIKGKSAIAIARNFMGRRQNYTGPSFWARGYYLSTVGRDEERIKNYIQL